MVRQLCVLSFFPVLATAVYGTEVASSLDAPVDTTRRSNTNRVGPALTQMVRSGKESAKTANDRQSAEVPYYIPLRRTGPVCIKYRKS